MTVNATNPNTAVSNPVPPVSSKHKYDGTFEINKHSSGYFRTKASKLGKAGDSSNGLHVINRTDDVLTCRLVKRSSKDWLFFDHFDVEIVSSSNAVVKRKGISSGTTFTIENHSNPHKTSDRNFKRQSQKV